MSVLIKIRRDSSANWAAYNPVLALGEPAYTLDTNEFAVGDGFNPHSALPKIKPQTTIDLSAYALSADVQGGYDNLQGQVTVHQTSIDNLSALQLVDNQHLSNLDNDVNNINGQLNNFANSIVNFTGNISSINNDIANHAGRLDNHDIELANLEQARLTAVANDAAHNNQLLAHDVAISELVQDVALLQGFTIGEIDGGGAAG